MTPLTTGDITEIDDVQWLHYSSLLDRFYNDMTMYLGDARLYLESIREENEDEPCAFIYYSSKYNAFFDEFGAIIVNIFSYLHPWQVEIFLDHREYMYFYNGPSGPVEVDYVDAVEDSDLDLGPAEYFERR